MTQRIDPSVVRGLEYYTGPVYEVELTFSSRETRTASRCASARSRGGGRYDGLVGRFRSDDIPATGISIGVSRLMAALQHLKKVDTQARSRPGRRHGVRSGSHRRLPEDGRGLRSAGIRAELYLGVRQVRRADEICRQARLALRGHPGRRREGQRRGADQGPDPRRAPISSIKDREEYKAKQAEAQFAVPEADLLDGVRRVLTRHGVKWD